MNILSLFDGIACARVALRRAGIKVDAYAASEIDMNAISIAQRNWRGIVQLGDIKNIHASGWKVDLMIGGSPCQDLSIAKNNREGLKGSRSGLFWEYVRILKEVKPRFFILENVASMPKEARDEITKTLGVEPIMINAALVSAQTRKRYFWTNIKGVKLPKDREIFLKDILEEHVPIDKNGYELRKSNTAGGGGQGGKTGLYAVPVALRNRGKGKKPEYNGTGKANAITTVRTDSMVDKPPIRKLTAIECERLQCLPDGYTAGVSETQRYKALGNAFNVEVVAHILKAMKRQIHAERE